jgi:hypothetical protein
LILEEVLRGMMGGGGGGGEGMRGETGEGSSPEGVIAERSSKTDGGKTRFGEEGK